MNSFFSANEVHFQGPVILDAVKGAQHQIVASLGIENLLCTLNVNTQTELKYPIDHSGCFQAMALHRSGKHALIGNANGEVMQFNLNDQSISPVMKMMGAVTDIKYAPSGSFFAVAGEEGKIMVVDPETGSKDKCRPGHSGSISHIFFSKNQKFIGSTGQDQQLLIYHLQGEGNIQEVVRYTITKMTDCSALSGCFHWNQPLALMPGMPQLQKIQRIGRKWQHSMSSIIVHQTNILMTQTVKPNTLVTSTLSQVCIWDIAKEEKLYEIDQMYLAMAVPIAGKFFGVKQSDGKVYTYTRELIEEEPMEVESMQEESEGEGSKIQFNVDQPQAGDAKNMEEDQEQIELQYSKKSKAQKIIKCFPQGMVSTATNYFQKRRFVWVNSFGYVIQRIVQDQTVIDIEFQPLGKGRSSKSTLSKNPGYRYFDLNQELLLFANDTEFGIKPSRDSSLDAWNLKWNEIQAVTIGAGWVAIANDELIKIYDLLGHPIKSIAFDRQIVALRAHQNMLAVVFHEGIPMWGAQLLAVKLYLVNCKRNQPYLVHTIHLPIKPGQQLKWIGFSQQGMMFSQDTLGAIRCLSLETNQWTRVKVEGIQQHLQHKVWVIGFRNYKINYWRVSDQDPQPTVAPRFNIRTNQLFMPTVGQLPDNTQTTYERLLWKRFVLDHEKARARLWGGLKLSRQQNDIQFHLSESIMTDKQIVQSHNQLDDEYHFIIQAYLRAGEGIKALNLAKSCIRSIESLKRVSDIFDDFKMRSLAIQLENYCQELKEQLNYQQMQVFNFMKMRQQAQKFIKPKNYDPMRRGSRKNNESIPSFSQSYNSSQVVGESQYSMENRFRGSQISVESEGQNKQAQAANPFVKKRSGAELQSKKREIMQDVEKFGIKKKVDEKGRRNK